MHNKHRIRTRGGMSLRRALGMAMAGAMIISGTAAAFRQKAWAADTGKSSVSALRVQEVSDGTGPFDSDDRPGNDSGQSNGIVRSFDTIGYTLAYTTMLKTVDPVNEGKLMAEFTLPSGKTTAQWDLSQMAWMENPKVMVNADGSQTLTGSKTLRNTAGHNAIPGAGTLSAGVAVKGALNGTKIQPSFRLWMEGNAEGEKKSVTAKTVTVSAAPKVDAEIQYNWTDNDIGGYFDFSSGSYSNDKKDGYKRGRLQSYGIALRLFNDSASKGLKGIEIPSGDISFDITFGEFVSSQGKITPLSGTEYTPLLWDYRSNKDASSSEKGALGRSVSPDGHQFFPVNQYIPGSGKESRARNYTYDNGAMRISGTGPKVHVTVSGYGFDAESWHFPSHYMILNSDPDYPANIGYFSTGDVFALLTHPDKVTEQKDVYMSAEISNLSVTTESGQKGEDVYRPDDRYARTISLYPAGSISHDTIFESSSIWGSPDTSAYIGSSTRLSTEGRFSYDGRHAKAANNLLKFDTDGLEPAETGTLKGISFYNSLSKSGDVRLLYAAKKDGTGWKDQDERNTIHEKDLVFYDSLQKLKDAGKVPVGMLVEMRNSDLLTGSFTSVWKTSWTLRLKKDAVPGNTYGAVSDIDIWMDGTSFERLGHDGEPLPDAGEHHSSYSTYYKKAEFDSNGNIIAGTHTGGYKEGNTVTAISMWARITKKTADKDASGKAKTAYDMDSNERTARYALSISSEGPKAGGKDSFMVKDVLPKDLYYIAGSASSGSSRLDPEVTANADGTTTLTWRHIALETGKKHDDIVYSVSIGNAGSADDVTNNQQLMNTATIISETAPVKPTETWGTKTTVGITVIKLTSTSIRKSTDTPKVDIGQRFRYTFDFANGTQSALSNVRLFDVLPYNGDGRNTSFSGSYTVDSVTADFSKAPSALASVSPLQASSSAQARKNDYAFLSSYGGWTETAGTKSGSTVTWKPAPDTKAIGIRFNAGGYESVKVTVTLVPGAGQKEGDSYINDILENADGQVQYVRSNRAVVQIRGNITIGKKWDDWNDALRRRPSSVEATVLQNGVRYATATLSASGGWKARIADVPVFDQDGNRYRYTVTDSVSHYSPSQTASASDPLSLTLSNTYRTHNLTVSKKAAGNLASRSRRYAFTVSLTGLVPNAKYAVQAPDGQSSVTADGTGKATATVRIRSGEKAVIKDLPEEATFQTTEERSNSSPEFSINGGTAAKGRTTPVTKVTDAMSVSYTNRLVAFLPTGISRSLGMIAMMDIAIGAVLAAFLMRRRRKG